MRYTTADSSTSIVSKPGPVERSSNSGMGLDDAVERARRSVAIRRPPPAPVRRMHAQQQPRKQQASASAQGSASSHESSLNLDVSSLSSGGQQDTAQTRSCQMDGSDNATSHSGIKRSSTVHSIQNMFSHSDGDLPTATATPAAQMKKHVAGIAIAVPGANHSSSAGPGLDGGVGSFSLSTDFSSAAKKWAEKAKNRTSQASVPSASAASGSMKNSMSMPDLSAADWDTKELLVVDVRFSVKVSTAFGEKVKVIGSTAALGNWDPQSGGLDLSTDTHTFPVWRGNTSMKLRRSLLPVEFKFVIQRSNGELVWEDDVSNRTIWPSQQDVRVHGFEFNKPAPSETVCVGLSPTLPAGQGKLRGCKRPGPHMSQEWKCGCYVCNMTVHIHEMRGCQWAGILIAQHSHPSRCKCDDEGCKGTCNPRSCVLLGGMNKGTKRMYAPFGAMPTVPSSGDAGQWRATQCAHEAAESQACGSLNTTEKELLSNQSECLHNFVGSRGQKTPAFSTLFYLRRDGLSLAAMNWQRHQSEAAKAQSAGEGMVADFVRVYVDDLIRAVQNCGSNRGIRRHSISGSPTSPQMPKLALSNVPKASPVDQSHLARVTVPADNGRMPLNVTLDPRFVAMLRTSWGMFTLRNLRDRRL